MFRRQKKISEQGFTLIELITLLVLIGVVSAISFPKLNGFLEQRQFRSGINSIVGLIKHIRYKAATTKTTYFLNFDIEENQYWVTHFSGEDLVEDKTFSEGRRNFNASITLLAVEFPGITQEEEEGEETAIRFLPTGSVDGAILHLKNSTQENTFYSLHINPFSGKVTMKEGFNG